MGFFDKLKEQASSLGDQLDSALDSTKQKGQINTMRKQRGEMISQLGESLLEQFRQQNVNAEQLHPQADEIFKLEWQIIETEKQMEAQKQAAAEAKAQPPMAGPPAAPPASGPPPAPPAPPAAPEGTNCTACGTEIPEGSAFCPSCGNKAEG
jgi:phage tail tape-measure protein